MPMFMAQQHLIKRHSSNYEKKGGWEGKGGGRRLSLLSCHFATETCTDRIRPPFQTDYKALTMAKVTSFHL